MYNSYILIVCLIYTTAKIFLANLSSGEVITAQHLKEKHFNKGSGLIAFQKTEFSADKQYTKNNTSNYVEHD